MLSYLNFQSVPVVDQDRALAFYRDTLGMTVQTDAPYEGERRWIMLEIPGARTKIHFGERADETPSRTPDLAIVSPDVDAACAALKARGVAIEQGPADAPWDPATRWALFRDTEGNLILIQTVREV